MTWWVSRALALLALVFAAGFVVGGGIVVAKQAITDSKLPPGPEAYE
ncbi:MAG: hypothetical protein ACM3N5_01760 [Candidatus Eiseniibacteriota bacterium]